MEEKKKSEKKMRTQEEILHEYPAVGRYRVRVVHKNSPRNGGTALDVREYVSAEKFEGFTRRGIRLSGKEDVDQLRDILIDTTSRGWFEKPVSEEKGAA